jgi:hypothetical protein
MLLAGAQCPGVLDALASRSNRSLSSCFDAQKPWPVPSFRPRDTARYSCTGTRYGSNLEVAIAEDHRRPSLLFPDHKADAAVYDCILDRQNAPPEPGIRHLRLKPNSRAPAGPTAPPPGEARSRSARRVGTRPEASRSTTNGSGPTESARLLDCGSAWHARVVGTGWFPLERYGAADERRRLSRSGDARPGRTGNSGTAVPGWPSVGCGCGRTRPLAPAR